MFHNSGSHDQVQPITVVALGFDPIELEVFCSAFSVSRLVFLNVYQMPSEVDSVEEMLSLHENLGLILRVLICWFHEQDYFIPLIHGFRVMNQSFSGCS